jgi:hypothetical protein
MMKLLTGVLILFVFTAPASAGTISYTFTGEGGLSGGFTLDEAAWDSFFSDFPTNPPSEVRGGVLVSPLNTLWGSWGSATFEGTPTLHVVDYTDPDWSDHDYWIVRTPIASSEGAMPTITFFGLYVSQYLSFPSGVGLTPPPITSPDYFRFQYGLSFSDDSSTSGRLTSLVMVPDAPSSLLLMAVSLASLAGLRARVANHHS